jgi:hypothetical protein
MTTTIFLLIITYLLNIIDYFQTIYGTSIYGPLIEGNPLVAASIGDAWWISKFGLPLIALIGIGVILYYFKFLRWVAYIPMAWYLFVIVNNCIILYELGLLL